MHHNFPARILVALLLFVIFVVVYELDVHIYINVCVFVVMYVSSIESLLSSLFSLVSSWGWKCFVAVFLCVFGCNGGHWLCLYLQRGMCVTVCII